jgi:peroxiredoxin
MELGDELAAFKAAWARTAPTGRPALYEAMIVELRTRFVREAAPAAGDRAPDFALPEGRGRTVALADLLREGPAVVTFYRGGWCPYCNIQLRAYQAALPRIAARGGRLAAISPQRPDGSLSTAETNALTFDVLSDAGNAAARRYGLVFALPDALREIMRANGKALPDVNGDDSWELPVPATFVVARDGRIALAHVEVDYRARLEPAAIVAALDALRPG